MIDAISLPPHVEVFLEYYVFSTLSLEVSKHRYVSEEDRNNNKILHMLFFFFFSAILDTSYLN